MARPPNTDRIFKRKEADNRPITSETIVDHLQAFQSAGGHIEVLGNTRVLKKIDDDVPGAPPPAPARRGSR
ncbi:hypothetical protein [Lysobacter tyrosinilyticus]